jgi:hypothetical protein
MKPEKYGSARAVVLAQNTFMAVELVLVKNGEVVLSEFIIIQPKHASLGGLLSGTDG